MGSHVRHTYWYGLYIILHRKSCHPSLALWTLIWMLRTGETDRGGLGRLVSADSQMTAVHAMYTKHMDVCMYKSTGLRESRSTMLRFASLVL
jgi:hypothetical protein